MICPSPNISTALLNRNKTVVQLGFEMDNVESVKDVTTVTVISDPVFFSFPGPDRVMVLKTEDLILKVRTSFYLFNSSASLQFFC